VAKIKLHQIQGVLACDLTARQLEEALQGFCPTVRSTFHCYVRAVFNFNVKRDYLAGNSTAYQKSMKCILAPLRPWSKSPWRICCSDALLKFENRFLDFDSVNCSRSNQKNCSTDPVVGGLLKGPDFERTLRASPA